MNEIEKTETIRKILDKIEEYDRIIICRHIRPDGDCVGASGGLCELIRASYPSKTVKISNKERCDYAAFAEAQSDCPESDEYVGALCIVVDTATSDRISDDYFRNSDCLIKIDHHIDTEAYGCINFTDETRGSCCEMIADLSFRSNGILPMTASAAEKLYTGMMTDTDRFRYSPDAETFRTASMLIPYVDSEKIYTALYIDTFEHLKFKAAVTDMIRMTPNGVAYMYVDAAMQRRLGLSREDASSVISFMSNIKGCPVWLAFIDNMPDNQDDRPESIRVRLRSRFIGISDLAGRYRGGGHEKAAGATVYTAEEMESLLNEADELVAAAKAQNPSIY